MLMATLTIRQLDNDVYERLKAQAKANSRSLEAEVRRILSDRTDHPRLVDEMRAFQRKMIARNGHSSGSLDAIRAIRDEM